ncbi:zinc finger protein basonuclin-2-like [Fundulus heteroclitus]|uniref:zinc finger protein basonuclin-2-like n=1 Tax=Fundulus heteroclitus TaxID=8078 RepID=UPI00165C35E3|nr:zinc finger protein basonuclin-2-like [Fundulus heteroclitus]
MRMTPNALESIRCGVSSCSCAGFTPRKVQLRSCDRCGHGWVEHALEQFQAHPPSGSGPVEVALPGLVFDLSSLVLFGAQAVPVQLKILLDRLYSILTPEQVGQILNSLGWSLGDYVRGYMLQHPGGKVLDRWSMATPEEELLVLRQFLRFGETRPIVELMMLQYLDGGNLLPDEETKASVKTVRSDILTEKGASVLNRSSLSDVRMVDGNDTSDDRENDQLGQSLLLPFHFPQSAIYCSNKDMVPSAKLQNILPDFGGTKPVQKHVSGDVDLVRKRSERQSASSKKPDPDKTNPSLQHQNPVLHLDDVFLQKRLLQQEKTLASSFNFSFLPSSLLYSPIPHSSSTLLQRHQKSQTLPSFSSSFIRPLHSSSLHPLTSASSSLHSLPPSLCAFPSLPPEGGRKGRVSCGVCGKSFYDKGTLKIHYNAVHLKIKHRCTVTGCTMVFSSLRSRNRHSANPNPRLHTGSSSREAHPYRNAACGRGGIHSETQIYEVKTETQTLVPANRMKNMHEDSWLHEPASSSAPPPVPPAPSSSFPSSCGGQHWWPSSQSLPKKKPRKSSMPVKIEREAGRRQETQGGDLKNLCCST